MYFRRRERGPKPTPRNTIGEHTIKSLLVIIDYELLYYTSDPETLPTCRCRLNTYLDIDHLNYLVKRDIPDFDWGGVGPSSESNENESYLDLVELCYQFVDPSGYDKCDSGQFDCLRWKTAEKFRSEVNRVFARDGANFELHRDGKILRTGMPFVTDIIQDAVFQTGDDTLDSLFHTARDKFASRDSAVRFEGLLMLWDAWERLKTLDVPGDKRASTSALLDRVADGPMRERLEAEARELTDIGNQFMIRHSETDRHPLDDDRHVDYLFHRMFSLIYMLLDATGRLGSS